MASSSNVSSSYYNALVAQEPNFVDTEGFRQFHHSYNTWNTYCSQGNPIVAYLTPKEIYQKAKNTGRSEQTFSNLTSKDFVGATCVIVCHKLKRISIAHYQVQLNHCACKWDHRICEGTGDKIVGTCCQLIRSIGVGFTTPWQMFTRW